MLSSLQTPGQDLAEPANSYSAREESELATSANPQAEATADFQTVSHPVHDLARAEGPVQQADPELAELVSSHLAWEQAMADSKPAWHPVRPGHLVVIGIPTAWRICQQQRRHPTWKWEYPDAEQCPQQEKNPETGQSDVSVLAPWSSQGRFTSRRRCCKSPQP